MTVEIKASQVEAALCPEACLRGIVEDARRRGLFGKDAESWIKRRCQQAGFRCRDVTSFNGGGRLDGVRIQITGRGSTDVWLEQGR